MGKTLARRGCAALLSLFLVLVLAPAASAAAAGTNIDVRLDKTNVTIPAGDTSIQLKATVYENGTATNNSVNWSSSNTNAVTVNGGQLTAVATGSATITATYTDSGSNKVYTGTCEVRVIDANVKSIAVKLLDAKGNEVKELNLEVGESTYLYIDVSAVWSDNTTDPPKSSGLSWRASSSDNAVSIPHTGGEKGVQPIEIKGVKATKAGSPATITVDVEYTNLMGAGTVEADPPAVCKVNVVSKNDVVITEYGVATRELDLVMGESYPANGVYNPWKELKAYLATDNQWIGTEDIKWSIVTGDSVTIRDMGDGTVRVTPAKTGTTTLKAEHTSGADNTVTCIVTEKAGTDPTDPSNPTKPSTNDKLPDGVKAMISITGPASTASEPYIMDPGTTNVDFEVKFVKTGMTAANTPAASIQWSQSGGAVAVYEDTDGRYELPITWESSSRDTAQVTAGGSRYQINANQPGTASLTAAVSDKTGQLASDTLYVEVSGFILLKDAVEIEENGSMELDKDGIIGVYGTAKTDELACWSDASNIAAYAGGKIAAYVPGETTFTVSDTKRGFRASFDVTVTADPNATIDYGTLYVKTQKVLNFSDLLSRFRRQAGGRLSHITGLNMDSSKGTLYYKYKESSGSGTGVGAGSYYHPYRSGGIPTGGQSLEDLTFVPKSGYAGQVTIYYTAVSEEGQNYTCRLELIVDPGSGSDAGIVLDTPYNTPLRFTGDDFNRVCRERLGVKLDYVTFSQPPERQGTLYTNYSGSGNYGSAVDMHRKYSLKELDDIWFVPAPGYSGTVTVYYTAFGVGTNAGSYAGQVDIVVGRENGVAIGGLTYDIAKGGVAHFDDADFEQYCRELTDRGQELSFIRFNALPAGSEGVLYYDYRSSSSTGSRAATGTNYYYGSRSPRIDWLAFVPAEDFVGTVRIPFTGWTTDGGSFSGNVEVNVRSGVATQVGDILYICPAGKTVSFDDTDFNRLSRNVTGSSLNYITFRSLPASSAGTLYYNSSRAVTGTRYRNGTSTPRIDNLSFRASSSFSGIVDIPFEAQATNGDTFRGVVTVSSSRINSSTGSGDYWGSGGASTTVFTDMAGYSDSQKAAVDYIYSRGITHGLTATLYGPQNSIRRGDFALMIYQAFGLTSSSAAQPFVDVPAGAYYSQAVNALYSRGVVSGVGGGYYAPDSTLTRQDAVCMVQRAMRATGRSAEDGSSSALYSYSDGGSVSGYAQGAMAMAVQRDYLPTYGGWLNPTQALTRVDMAEILYRVLTY